MAARWTEAELARYLTHGPTGQVTEAVFQTAIRRLAQQHGWLYYHTYLSKKSAEGYPDVTLAKIGAPLILAELKTITGQLTKAQEAWLEALAGSTGVVSCVWRPTDLEAIVKLLRG